MTPTSADDKVNVLIVDDQPAKLLSYEVMLEELGNNLVKASSAKAALEILLKTEIAVVLIDVCMPELDGFELASMIRDHPRFQKIAIIFVSAIHLAETDHLRGYDLGAVDYVPVPVVPQVLRAKVRVFAELFRKTKQLEKLNAELESRVAERTAELEAAAAHQALLAREVDHRARNALAIVQSIVRLTRADAISDYIRAVDGRIHALAQAHELLSQSRWQGADIRRLAEEEMAPYRAGDSESISLEGPALMLPPDRAQAIALVLHELATNAVKYGALSVQNGHVGIAWRQDGKNLKLTWSESGGPPVSPPEREGFGAKIISASINKENDGEVAFDWQPGGLKCALNLQCELTPRPMTDGHTNGAGEAPAGTGNRILLVEDEAMVAMLMEDYLSDMGVTIAGPVSHLAEAMETARKGGFVGAVLDVNLRGEPIYPVADVLMARGIPFIFVTGYAGGDIEPRFAEVPMLQKPLARDALEQVLRAIAPSAFVQPPASATGTYASSEIAPAA